MVNLKTLDLSENLKQPAQDENNECLLKQSEWDDKVCNLILISHNKRNINNIAES